MATHSQVGHWRRSRLLALTIVVLWAVFTLALPFFLSVSDGVLLGKEAGYSVVGEGIPVLIVGLVFWFVRRQRGFDRQFAVAEED